MIFVYRPGNSFFHRMDAVTKFLWLITTTMIVLLANTFFENVILFIYLLFTALILGRQHPIRFVLRLLPITLVGIWLFVVMAVFYTRGETPWFDLGPITFTREGAAYGGALFFRIFSLGTASFTFSLTTEPQRMVAELVEYGRMPYRLAYSFYTGLRFLPLLQSEAEAVLNAHAVRGVAEKEKSFFARLVPLRRLATPLLVNGLRRVRITAIAMDSRAFGAYPRRTNILELSRTRSSFVYLGLHVLALTLFFIWRIVLGHGAVLPRALLPGFCLSASQY